MSTADAGPGGRWALLTSHGYVLAEIARNPDATTRDLSAAAGITDRAARTVVADLEAAGYITRGRAGRHTRYTVRPRRLFRQAGPEGYRAGAFVDLLARTADDPRPPARED